MLLMYVYSKKGLNVMICLLLLFSQEVFWPLQGFATVKISLVSQFNNV